MQIKYGFDGVEGQSEILLFTGADYLVFEQKTDNPCTDFKLIQFDKKDIPGLIKALQSFIAGA